jgi:hypothetical protein
MHRLRNITDDVLPRAIRPDIGSDQEVSVFRLRVIEAKDLITLCALRRVAKNPPLITIPIWEPMAQEDARAQPTTCSYLA